MDWTKWFSKYTIKIDDGGVDIGYRQDSLFEKTVQQNVVLPKFYSKVWDEPIIESDLQNTQIAKLLDWAGIDKILKTKDGQLFGLSQRIQRRKFAKYKSLTIRNKCYRPGYHYNSEWEKINNGIKNHSIVSLYRSHCYANGDDAGCSTDLLDGVIVNQFKLFNWMNENKNFVYKGKTKDKGNGYETFFFVYFDDLPDDVVIARYKINGSNDLCLDAWGSIR